MAGKIEWNDEYLLGILEIDNQHKNQRNYHFGAMLKESIVDFLDYQVVCFHFVNLQTFSFLATSKGNCFFWDGACTGKQVVVPQQKS